MQKEFLSRLLKENKNAIIVGSLGTISRDLKDIPHPNKIYVKGAMGGATAVGLGIALNTKKKVLVIIGEGALLMKLGTLATLARYSPKNLKIQIIVNNVYASTGGQSNNFHCIQHLFNDCLRNKKNVI